MWSFKITVAFLTVILQCDKKSQYRLLKRAILSIWNNPTIFCEGSNVDLSDTMKALAEFKKSMNEADSIEHLMLIEARMREAYFS